MDPSSQAYFESRVGDLIQKYDLPSNPYPDIMELLTDAWNLGRVSAIDATRDFLRDMKGRP